MEIDIRPLRKKDFNAVRKFAIQGMHLDWYTGNGIGTKMLNELEKQ